MLFQVTCLHPLVDTIRSDYEFSETGLTLFADNGGTGISKGVIVGIAIGGTVLVLGLVVLGLYAIRQKKRAEKALELSRPFGNISFPCEL